MNQEHTYQGSCFCGDVEFTLSGEPEAMAYCHCDSCRRWSAGPVSAFTLWQPGSVNITKGQNKIAGFDKNPGSRGKTVVSIRQWCKNCGGHIFTDHPTMKLIDVPSAVIAGLTFKPGFHLHYQESVHAIKDGLPKFKELPEAAGGSGEKCAE